MTLLLSEAAASDLKQLPKFASEMDALAPSLPEAPAGGFAGKHHPTYFDNDEELPFWEESPDVC